MADARRLGDGIGPSLREIISGRQAPALPAFYESWSIPVLVKLAAPVGMLIALSFQPQGLQNDVRRKAESIAIIGKPAYDTILIIASATACAGWAAP